MNIRRISCTQFAGLSEKSIPLQAGINILFGENESGKSTMVHLLSRTLFQNARLDRRSDREFRQLYFPAPYADNRPIGDFIDGSVVMEGSDGLYTLHKEWGEDPRCTLAAPTGILRSTPQVEETLRSLLVYGEGVWNEILLSSQNGTLPALDALLNPAGKSDARPEITAAATAAFAETGALSVDAIGQAIREKTDTIAGKHWDAEAGLPIRKTGGGRWSSGLGEILKAYYDREDARFLLTETERLEKERDSAAQSLNGIQRLLEDAQKACASFEVYAQKLSLQKERRDTLTALEQEYRRLSAVLQNWPRLEQEYEAALSLQKEQQARTLLDTCEAVRHIREEIREKTEQLSSMPCPSVGEIQLLRQNMRRIAQLENRLCGMNLTALLRLENGHSAEIRSLRTGETVRLSAEPFSLTEAVRITVPGVIDLVLTPSEVNADEIQGELTGLRKAAKEILQKYPASDADELEELLRRHTELRRECALLQERLSMTIGSRDAAELQKQAEELTSVPRSSNEILADIRTMAPDGDIARLLAARETLLSGFRQEYGTPQALREKWEELHNRLQSLRTLLEEESDIPEKYRRIDNPALYLRTLRQSAEHLRTEREDALRKKAEAQTRLETFRASIREDPLVEAERTEQIFQQTKELLSHWLHISAVFEEQKKRLSDSPLKGLADTFLMYLRLLSDGRITSDFPEKDALQMRIFTGERLVDFARMSAGTRQIVSFAFRLAVLDQLFPAGGGVIVLDDPLTDMDAPRTEQACRLIRSCAQRHQILFLTCREEYLSLLGGNILRMNEL